MNRRCSILSSPSEKSRPGLSRGTLRRSSAASADATGIVCVPSPTWRVKSESVTGGEGLPQDEPDSRPGKALLQHFERLGFMGGGDGQTVRLVVLYDLAADALELTPGRGPDPVVEMHGALPSEKHDSPPGDQEKTSGQSDRKVLLQVDDRGFTFS